MQLKVPFKGCYSTISFHHGIFYIYSTSCNNYICDGQWDDIFKWPKVTTIEWELGWLSSIFDNQTPWHWRVTGEPTHQISLAAHGPVFPNQSVQQRPVL